jgi:hypothetical protein
VLFRVGGFLCRDSILHSLFEIRLGLLIVSFGIRRLL